MLDQSKATQYDVEECSIRRIRLIYSVYLCMDQSYMDGIERRSAQRLKVSWGQVWQGDQVSDKVVDISANGIGLVNHELVSRQNSEISAIQLGSTKIGLPARIVRSSNQFRGARFVGTNEIAHSELNKALFVLQQRKMSWVNKFNPQATPHLQYNDSYDIKKILSSLCENSPFIFGYNHVGHHAATMQFTHRRDGFLHGIPSGDWQDISRFVVSGVTSAFLFSTNYKQEDDLVSLKVPSTMVATGRGSSRATVPEDCNVYLEFTLDRTPGSYRAKINQVSIKGCRIENSGFSHLLAPEDTLRSATVVLPSGDRLECQAVVRCAQFETHASYGIHITSFEDEKYSHKWGDFVFTFTDPRVDIVRRDNLLVGWRVLQDCGYLKKWAKNDAQACEDEYKALWENTTDSYSRTLVLSNQEKPVGTFAMSKLYPTMWMGHHFGIVKSRDRSRKEGTRITSQLLKAVFNSVEGLPAIKYWVIHFSLRSGWGMLSSSEFHKLTAFKEQNILSEYNTYLCDAQVLSTTTKNLPLLRLSVAKPDESQKVGAFLSQKLHKVEVAAYEYSPDKISLKDFESTTITDGYPRHRRIILAESEMGSACAILDIGPPGLNAFGAQNTCRIFSLSENPSVSVSIRSSLLTKASKMALSLGCRSFVYIDQQEDHKFERLGMNFACRSGSWVFQIPEMSPVNGFFEALFAKLS